MPLKASVMAETCGTSVPAAIQASGDLRQAPQGKVAVAADSPAVDMAGAGADIRTGNCRISLVIYAIHPYRGFHGESIQPSRLV